MTAMPSPRGRGGVLAATAVLVLGVTIGCTPGRDLGAEARATALDDVRYLRARLEQTVQDAGPVSDADFAKIVVTDVVDRIDGLLEQTAASQGRSTWRGAMLGSADGWGKTQVAAAACFDAVVDRRGTPTVSFTDAPCSDLVSRRLASTGSEGNIASVADLAED